MTTDVVDTQNGFPPPPEEQIAQEVLETLAELFVYRGGMTYIRSDNDPEFSAIAVTDGSPVSARWAGIRVLVGTYLAVPLTATLQIILASNEHTHPIAVMLSSGPPRKTHRFLFGRRERAN